MIAMLGYYSELAVAFQQSVIHLVAELKACQNNADLLRQHSYRMLPDPH